MMLEPDGDADKQSADRSDFLDEYEITPLVVSLSTPQSSVSSSPSDHEEKNVFGWDYIGIPAHFWNVGLLSVASIAVLYPVLIIEGGASSSVYTASTQLVNLFYSYRIFFGLFTDAFHIRQRHWKPYMLFAWTMTSIALLSIVILGRKGTMSITSFVWFLTIANIGGAISDCTASGFMTWIAHHEPKSRSGHAQTTMYIVKELGRVVSNILVVMGFSGPLNCPGYPEETDCRNAIFPFDISLSQFAGILLVFSVTGVILTIPLREEPSNARNSFTEVRKTLFSMWEAAQNRAVWQLMLFTMISNTLFSISNAAKYNANFVWLELTTFQNQMVWLMESVVFVIGLSLIKHYFINTSWRKLNLIGMGIVSTMNLLYLLVIYNITRNVWFYVIFSTTESFMHTANFLVNVFCIIEVAPEGMEAVTYSLITSATAVTHPLATTVSIALLSFFPALNEQNSFSDDTPAVRNSMAALMVIVVVLNWTGLLAMPMLPRQRQETRDLVERNETSKTWAAVALTVGLCALIYSTLVTIFSARGGCAAILGGPGCSDGKPIGVYLAMAVIFGFCYIIPTYHVYWPIVIGKERFTWRMFV